MKRRFFAVIAVCLIAGSFTVNAGEKKNIIVKTWTNVLVDATHNYAVNRQGDLLTYSFSTDGGGAINAISYTLIKKNERTKSSGSIDITYIPANSANMEVVGLDGNTALIKFTKITGERYFMVFKMRNNEATPTPNKNDYVQKIMADNETCTLDKTRILLYTYKEAAMINLLGISVFNYKWKASKNKGIDFNPSHGVLTVLNPGIQKYYKGVIDRGGNLYDIQILKP